jgi:hypothetical protein
MIVAGTPDTPDRLPRSLQHGVSAIRQRMQANSRRRRGADVSLGPRADVLLIPLHARPISVGK